MTMATTAEVTMTFEQFRATGMATTDLGVLTDDAGLSGQAGRIYAGGLYVEETTAWAHATARGLGRWYTVVGNREYHADDLATVEAALYEFARAEGIA
jgi:hypothetical protein